MSGLILVGVFQPKLQQRTPRLPGWVRLQTMQRAQSVKGEIQDALRTHSQMISGTLTWDTREDTEIRCC